MFLRLPGLGSLYVSRDGLRGFDAFTIRGEVILRAPGVEVFPTPHHVERRLRKAEAARK